MELSTQEVINIAGSLAAIKSDVSHISESITELKKIVSLEPGSPLRDSMTLLIGEQMREQKKICGREMGDVAEKIANEKIEKHIETYHKSGRRISEAPRPRSNWAKEFFAAARPALPWVIAALGLGGGGTIIATQNTTQPAAQIAPAENKSGE